MRGVRLEAQSARRWSTEDVDPQGALAYWVDTVGQRFLEVDIDPPSRTLFRARLEQVDLGATTASFIEAGSQRIYRTQAKISRTRYPVFMLLQLRVGQVRLQQSGREVQIRPGECVLVNGSEPYELECPQATNALALRLPEDWLKRWLPDPERLAGIPFRQRGGWSAALCAAVASLDVASCAHLAVPHSVVAEQIAVLLALAAGPEQQPVPPRASLFDKLLRTLRDRCHEADLAPSTVATEHSISVRSLHYAFARAATTFVEQLTRLRLELAREILSDARLSDLPIVEIAARCGFTDPSHFARRFRRQFTQAPSQFRHTTARARHQSH